MLKRLSGKLLSLLLCLTLVLAYSCDEDDDDSTSSTTTSGSSGTKAPICSTTYTHMTDAQLDAYCGAAYAYRCLDGKSLNDPSVVSVCNSYKLIKTSSAPDCAFCK